MYPDTIEKFRNLRKEWDPNGILSNTLIRQFFD
jgi:FAD/FMN-containing dehydrogenase